MFSIERREEILRILETSKSIRVEKLSKMLYVSQPTIRRDLSYLEEEGKVCRTHGGVVLRKSAESEIPLLLRESSNSRPKQIIAEKAIRHVKDGDVIFLDASSTVAYIVPLLTAFQDIIVLTNSPKTSIHLGSLNIKSYCPGGLLLPHSVAYVGSETERFIAGMNANILFFSSRGYTEGGCITDSSAEEAAVKKAMIKNAEKVFYLCDSSKRGKTYMYNICRTAEVDAVISETD